MPTTGEMESAANLPWYCCFIFLAAFITFISIFSLMLRENVIEWTIGLIVTWSACLFLTIYFGLRTKDKKATSSPSYQFGTTCFLCHGSSKCKYCGGSGKISKFGQEFILCEGCKGTGICQCILGTSDKLFWKSFWKWRLIKLKLSEMEEWNSWKTELKHLCLCY